MLRWSRPYESPEFFFGYVFLVVLTGFAVLVGYVGVRTRHHLDGTLPIVGVAIVVTWVVVWRWVRTGLFVGDDGVLLRWMWRSRTIGWDDIRSFSIGPYPVRGLDGDHRGLWIVCQDGSTAKAPVMLEPRRWGNSTRGGFEASAALRKGAFDELVADLRRLHAWSLDGTAENGPVPARTSTRRVRSKPGTRRWRRR